MNLYQAAVFYKYPEVQKVTCELWLLDADSLMSAEYTREQGVKHAMEFTKRFNRMTEETVFSPSPSKDHCRYCPFKRGAIGKDQQGTSDCVFSYLE
jgi:CRISPR/Cas system-associated exonuclease Cas4 (RecB family)